MKPACSRVDEIASRLAAHAGQAWTDLAEHPGYVRNIFREQALAMLAALDGPPLSARPRPSAPARGPTPSPHSAA